ncbi:MAG: hypothetical protein GY835_19835 [bacterium]|nr:hypothetical protein [bacterium]
MCYQECALYGNLVLYLRDRAAELLADDGDDVEAEQERLDGIIRDWFFDPQDELYGCAPRDLIWAEQKDEPNPIDSDRLAEFFFDDCPVCQFTRQELEKDIEAGKDPGFHWHYDDGGYPLIARYDPEGWDARWAEEDAAFEQWQTEQDAQEAQPSAPDYDPPPVQDEVPSEWPVVKDEVPSEWPVLKDGVPFTSGTGAVSPEEFIARARQPWLDPALHQAARALAKRVDCPTPTLPGSRYRRITYDEALSLAVGLHENGVDVESLLAQMGAFPYQNVALDWLSRPEMNAAMMVQVMEDVISPDDEDEMTRFRHHRDFIFALARVIHPGARLWLRGWLDGVLT